MGILISTVNLCKFILLSSPTNSTVLKKPKSTDSEINQKYLN